ncbi:MAG: glycoside hydrolase family protein [Campylobacteraceae bacterium]|nr:glycoside hydrolase family protein [Campylobacteraceae bacterium]
MNYSDLIREVKRDEGFRAKPYKCSEGFLTIGYGTKLPLSKSELANVKDPNNITEFEAEKLLQFRLENAIKELNVVKGDIIKTLNENRKEIIYNMVYQLGTKGLLGFKKMWIALENKDYTCTADEMKNSKWYLQTPKRAQRLINRMIER